MKHWMDQHRGFLLMSCDLLIVFCAYMLTIPVFPGITLFWGNAASVMLALCVFGLIIYFLGVNKSIWRYAQAPEFVLCLFASFISTLLFFGLDNLFCFSGRLSFFFYLVFFCFATLGIVGSRLLYRVNIGRLWRFHGSGKRRRTLLIGAGEAALSLIAESRENPNCDFTPVAAVDDDPSKIGRRIGGVPICGSTQSIPAVAKAYHINYIIVAIPSIGNQKRGEILDICAELGILVRMLPQVSDLPDVNDKRRILHSLRDITTDELLGRDEVQLYDEDVFSFLSGKRVLVTGGGGSIGSELCRQIANNAPAQLIIFDIYENNAYEIEQELRRKYGERLNLVVLIGSVRDYARLDSMFFKYRPDIVFHAAAHKHVPLMETSPQEAVKNNVFGTFNCARASMRYGVQKFILISTDKAVNPTNIMGCTKRVCEMIVQMLSGRSDTQFAAVRFGNVLGSNGSVIPLFKKQIAAGGPITVTDPKIIRYFMTIPEAAQLVLTAGAMACGGEIFVLDMGSPVKIVDLARKMIQLSGLREGKDIEIVYTGLRPGEKLYEELLMSEEGMKKTENSKIFIGHPIEMDPTIFTDHISELSHLVFDREPTPEEVATALSHAVDTFHHNFGEAMQQDAEPIPEAEVE